MRAFGQEVLASLHEDLSVVAHRRGHPDVTAERLLFAGREVAFERERDGGALVLDLLEGAGLESDDYEEEEKESSGHTGEWDLRLLFMNAAATSAKGQKSP